MYTIKSLVKRISTVAHFKELSINDLTTIVTSGQVLHFKKDATLFDEGGACAGLFVLFTGRVKLCKFSIQGQETIITVIKPVIMFNEVPVLDEGFNPVTAVAVEDCVAWQMSQEKFQMLLKEYPILGLSLLKVLATRSRVLLSLFEDVSTLSVKSRVAKVLLDISQNGEIRITRKKYTNLEMAAHAATGAPQFSRALKSFKEFNVITCTRTSIEISLPQRLAQIAQMPLTDQG
jgi:CRP-like cAMP-binding protein